VNVGGGDYLRWPRGFKSLTFQVPTDETRRAKPATISPQLAVLFTGKLRSPYLIQEVTRQNSNQDVLRDLTIYTTAVTIDLECAALVDATRNLTLATIAVSPH
jgi:hypothetical protein